MFVNTDPPAKQKLSTSKAPRSIYLPAEQTFLGRKHEAMSLDRDGAEALVKEAAERHRMDPALIRAVIETESKWNAGAVSRKGAVGLMQLIPSTAQRYGVKDLFNRNKMSTQGLDISRRCWNDTTATWTWPWRRTMLEKEPWTVLAACGVSGNPELRPTSAGVLFCAWLGSP